MICAPTIPRETRSSPECSYSIWLLVEFFFGSISIGGHGYVLCCTPYKDYYVGGLTERAVLLLEALRLKAWSTSTAEYTGGRQQMLCTSMYSNI